MFLISTHCTIFILHTHRHTVIWYKLKFVLVTPESIGQQSLHLFWSNTIERFPSMVCSQSVFTLTIFQLLSDQLTTDSTIYLFVIFISVSVAGVLRIEVFWHQQGDDINFAMPFVKPRMTIVPTILPRQFAYSSVSIHQLCFQYRSKSSCYLLF